MTDGTVFYDCVAPDAGLRSGFVAGLLGLLVGVVLAMQGCTGREASERRSERPNIVLIVADDLDPHHLGAYGGDLPTPHLDRLAASGLRFQRAYAPSSACTPSRYALLTGQYPGRTEHPQFLEENPTDERARITWNTPLTAQNVPLHEMLSSAGYFTAFAGKYHVGAKGAAPALRGLEAGADPMAPEAQRPLQAYQQRLQAAVRAQTGADAAASVLWANYPDTPLNAAGRAHNIEWMTNGAIDLLDRAAARDEPFFLSLATTALHGPNLAATLDANPHRTPAGRLDEPYRHHPPRDSVRARLVQQGITVEHYSAGMALLDDQVGALMDRLRALGVAENTVVVFTADHGTEPGKATVYEQGVRVPMIVCWPRHGVQGTSDRLAQLTDLWPTFADLAGASPDPERRRDGRSLAPLLRGQPDGVSDRSYAYFEMGYARGVTDGIHKYVALRYPAALLEAMQSGARRQAPNQMAMPGQVHSRIAMTYYPHYFDADQLYDLRRDPYEQRNLAGRPAAQDTLRRMRSALREVLATFRHPYPLDTPPFQASDQFARLAQRARQEANPEAIPWWPGDLEWPPDDRQHALRRE
jgi:arylsulfatase A-like enzyme